MMSKHSSNSTQRTRYKNHTTLLSSTVWRGTGAAAGRGSHKPREMAPPLPNAPVDCTRPRKVRLCELDDDGMATVLIANYKIRADSRLITAEDLSPTPESKLEDRGYNVKVCASSGSHVRRGALTMAG